MPRLIRLQSRELGLNSNDKSNNIFFLYFLLYSEPCLKCSVDGHLGCFHVLLYSHWFKASLGTLIVHILQI